MLELSVTHEGKARVWLQELPHCLYSVSQVLKCDIAAEESQEAGGRCAGIEVFLHRGGYCPYGLLGGLFVPAVSESVTLQVGISTSNGQVMDNTLAGLIDQVKIGLPFAYAESVLLGAASVSALSHLGSGTLLFDCAAHGEVGSSPHIFHRLAAIVTQLISLDPETVSNRVKN